MPSFLVRLPLSPGSYGEVPAVAISSGSGDAGKAVILGTDGKIHISMLPPTSSVKSLQDAYNGGAEILTTALGPVSLRVQSDADQAMTVKDHNGDTKIQLLGTGQIVAEHYSGSKLISLGQNINNLVVDSMDKTKFRAIQYMYTIQNSDLSGYETGKIAIIHNGVATNIYHEVNGGIGIPSMISFAAQLTSTSLELLATTDNSPFSRLVHLFKVALS